MNGVIASDAIKLKRTFINPIAYLYPIIVLFGALIIVASQKSNLLEQNNDMWSSMIVIVHFLIMFVVPIKLTIIISNLINVEHQTNAWKMILALPIRKSSFYFSKLFYILKVCMISGLLLFVGFILIGKILGFENSPPYLTLLQEAFYPYLGAFPIITFQLWLSIQFKNQAFPITIGIFGAICMFFLQMNTLTSYIFWAYPALLTPLKQVVENNTLAAIIPNDAVGLYALLSIIFGILFLLIGLYQFSKQEVE